MELRFPVLAGGQEQGLNDAGVEAFQGSIGQYVVRECAQNSGDAPDKSGAPVRVVFEILKWKTKDIPCVDQIRDACKASREYWSHDEKTRTFFDRALEELKLPSISVLRVGDYGTTGLAGGDLERTAGWYALVKSQGFSVKDDAAGGSYGIGKSSPFAASHFRTVFYSTKTLKQDMSFQGVCRLVTHENASGNTTQAVGFIGGYRPPVEGGDPLFTAIRNADEIPRVFSRSEVGTDVYIPGYFSPDDDWERELVLSVLNNFWPAIHRGSMEFQVGQHEINKDNIGELIEQMRGLPDFDAPHYYSAVASSKRKESEKVLYSVGKCRLFLSTEGTDLPKKVCLIRRAGMVIDYYGPHNMRTPYTGLFVCEDPAGNKLLRQMEPPRHDKWDPKRVEGLRGKEAIKEIRNWIRDKVRELSPPVEGDTFNESDLSKYLPEVEEGAEGASDSTNPGNEPGLFGRPSQKAPEVSAIPIDGKAIGEGAKGHGSEGSGTGDKGTPNPKKGDGKDTGGRVRRRGGGNRSGSPPLGLRSYQTGSVGDEYVVILRAEEDFTGPVQICAAGDEESDDDVEIISCANQHDGTALPFSGNRITAVVVRASHPLTLRVCLARPRRIALVLG